MSVDLTVETKTETKRKFFIEQIVDKHYDVKDNRAFDDLAKMCHDVLKIPRGSMHDTKKILGKVCQENNISFKQTKKSKGLGLKIEQTPRDPSKLASRLPQQQNALTQTNPAQNPGISKTNSAGQPTTNAQSQEQKKVLPPLTEADLPRYQRKTNKIIKLGKKIYLKFGIYTEEELKSHEENFKDLSDDVADYCIENNSRLPKQLEFYLIIAQIGFLFVIPIVKWAFKPRNKDDKKTEKKAEKKN